MIVVSTIEVFGKFKTTNNNKKLTTDPQALLFLSPDGNLDFHCAKGVCEFRMTKNMFAIVSVFKAGISFFLKCFLSQTNRRAYNSRSAYKWPDRIGIFCLQIRKKET